MAKITIANNDYILVETTNSAGQVYMYPIQWANKGGSMPSIPATVHYIIWDGSAGEVQLCDAVTKKRNGEQSLSSTSDVISGTSSTTVQNLTDWGDARVSDLKAEKLQKALTAANTWDRVRNERELFLSKSDWTQLPNTALTPSEVTAWATYRTSLRNIPTTYSAVEPKLIRFQKVSNKWNGIVQKVDGIEAVTINITNPVTIITPPSDIFNFS